MKDGFEGLPTQGRWLADEDSCPFGFLLLKMTPLNPISVLFCAS